MAGSTPDPPLKAFLCVFLFSGTGYSSAGIVYLTGEHFGIIIFKATSKFWRCTVHENLATKTKKYRPWEHKVGQIVNGRDSTMRRACELLGPNNHISSCICFYIYIYIEREREREDFALKAHTNKLF